MVTKTEQLQAAYEVLTSTPLLKEMITDHNVGSEEIAGIIERLNAAQAEIKADEEAAAIAQIEAIIKASKLDTALLARFVPAAAPANSKKATKKSDDTTSAPTFPHYFIDDQGEIKTGEFPTGARLASKNGNPAAFFKWAKNQDKARADFLVENQTMEQMKQIAGLYKEHLDSQPKPAPEVKAE